MLINSCSDFTLSISYFFTVPLNNLFTVLSGSITVLLSQPVIV